MENEKGEERGRRRMEKEEDGEGGGLRAAGGERERKDGEGGGLRAASRLDTYSTPIRHRLMRRRFDTDSAPIDSTRIRHRFYRFDTDSTTIRHGFDADSTRIHMDFQRPYMERHGFYLIRHRCDRHTRRQRVDLSISRVLCKLVLCLAPGFRVAAMAKEAASLLAAVNEFGRFLDERGGQYPRTTGALTGLRAALSEEFDVDLPETFRKRQRKPDAEARLQRQLAYQTKQRKVAEDKLAAASGKSSGLLQVELFAKVGLSDPSLNTRQVRASMRQHGCSVSHAYIGKIRFAFADLIKDAFRAKVKAEVGTLVADGLVGPVFVLHVHDEATMRFRSYSEAEPGSSAPGGSRARFSKIQNKR